MWFPTNQLEVTLWLTKVMWLTYLGSNIESQDEKQFIFTARFRKKMTIHLPQNREEMDKVFNLKTRRNKKIIIVST